MTELLMALAAYIEPPSSEHERLADVLGFRHLPSAAEHTDLFVMQLYPYASVYLGAEGMLGGEAADRVAGFWRAVGRTPPAEPDHLGALLQLAAALGSAAESESEPPRRALVTEARRALFHEHILSWVFPYLGGMERTAPPPYREWADLTRTVLAELAADRRGHALPAHLRAAPPMSDPRSDTAAFVPALLAPVRSGILLTRSDLHRAALRLGLGLRIGERAFALRSLLGQAPGPVLAWLEEEARWWSVRHEADPAPAAIARFWADRAGRTADLLASLAGETAAATVA